MKLRTTCLALVPGLALPLAFCMGAPTQGPKVREALAAAGAPNQGAATPSPVGEWSPIGPARFPHDRHVEEMEIECVTCHHETNAKPLSIPHQNYFDDLWIDCGIFHHGSGAAPLEPQSCSACHHSGNGDISDQTLSAKVVIHKNCWSCHEVGTGASASATCKTCHPPRS